MRVIGRLGLVGVWIVGCGFDTGGVASGGASVGDDGNDTTTAAEGDDDAPDDGPGPGDDDDDASATTPESGDPSSADDPSGEPTSDPSGDPTTTDGDDEGTSGVIDPSTDTGDPSSTTTDPMTDGGDEMPPENPYPNCSGPNTCEDGTQNCIELTPFMSWDVTAHACAPPCEGEGDCPAPQGDAMPACVSGFCRLHCDPDATTCPDGMQCYEVFDDPDVCLYPD
jgi:hypothetical protein